MKELNTVAPKKYPGNYEGTEPILDSSDGISIGDFLIDTSVTPNNIWQCINNTIGNTLYINVKAAIDELHNRNNFIAPPINPDSTGIAGQWSYDSNYFYKCVADNTWVRAAVETTWS